MFLLVHCEVQEFWVSQKISNRLRQFPVDFQDFQEGKIIPVNFQDFQEC